MTKRKKLGVLFLVLPLLILIIIIVAQIIVRVTVGSIGVSTPAIVTVVNIISLLMGMIATLGFLPSIIVGIILLTTDKKTVISSAPQTHGQTGLNENTDNTNNQLDN